MNTTATKSPASKFRSSGPLGALLASSITARTARARAAFESVGLEDVAFQVSAASRRLPASASVVILGEVLADVRALVSYSTVVAFRTPSKCVALPLGKYSRTTDRSVREFCAGVQVVTYGEDAFVGELRDLVAVSA
jgi:hypothetical protein